MSVKLSNPVERNMTPMKKLFLSLTSAVLLSVSMPIFNAQAALPTGAQAPIFSCRAHWRASL
jgi:hypothetical protein